MELREFRIGHGGKLVPHTVALTTDISFQDPDLINRVFSPQERRQNEAKSDRLAEFINDQLRGRGLK